MGMERELAAMIVEVLALPDVRAEAIEPEAPLFGEGLGLDSIDTLELVLALEESFRLDSTLVEADQYTLRNLNTIADCIERETR